MDMEHMPRAARAIGNRAHNTAQREVITSRKDRGRAAAFDDPKSSKFPSADNAVENAVQIRAKTLAAPEWEFVGPDALEHVGPVKI